LDVFDEVSTQTPLHVVRGDVQVDEHCPPLQVCVDAQALPHEPQLVRSVCVFTHAPLQLVIPVAHPHVPLEHMLGAAQP
jgi:hypothetical protein